MTYVRPHIYINKYPRFSVSPDRVSLTSLAHQLLLSLLLLFIYLLFIYYLFIYLFTYLFIIYCVLNCVQLQLPHRKCIELHCKQEFAQGNIYVHGFDIRSLRPPPPPGYSTVD